MHLATESELAEWNKLIAANPDGGNVLQVKALGDIKERNGWQPRYYLVNKLAVLVLTRRIRGLGEFWYVPKGPGVVDKAGLQLFAKAIRTLETQPFAVRIDPEINVGTLTDAQLGKLGYVRAPRNIQYNISTIVVDLTPSEDDILASFKQKTRYNVRLAGKKGMVAEAVEVNDATIDTFYKLAEETYRRAGVYVRSKQYFSDFWRAHAEEGAGQMFFARYEGQVLGAVFITYVGGKALYKDGASSREHSDVQAMAGLQWEVMRWLKAHGVTEYDLHGVPPSDQLDNPNHPLAGLARFKTGFNPEVTEFIGTFDLVLKAQKYKIWRRIGERVALGFENRVHKRLFY